LVALQGFGRFTYDAESAPVGSDTIFDLASLSKVIATTTMAMVLHERGLLDLSAPVESIVPEFAGEDSRRSAVSFFMLLAHSSGLPAYVKLFEHCNGRQEVLAAACRVPLEAAPGERAVYSDIGFIVLGMALERVTGGPLDEFCRREIFQPLAMPNTSYNPPATWRPRIPPTLDAHDSRHRIIQGEVNDENSSALGGVAGHAGLFASAEDVAHFAHCMVDGGQPIVRPATLELFTRRAASPRGTSRTMGWDTPSAPSQAGKYFSASSFGHLGFTGTSLWIDPERQLSVTLLTNRTWPDATCQKIKEVRPAFHDAVGEALGAR
jgi:serine-type D-Ala-D-Ala carboxypeptidase